jgi:hypothetical protein
MGSKSIFSRRGDFQKIPAGGSIGIIPAGGSIWLMPNRGQEKTPPPEKALTGGGAGWRYCLRLFFDYAVEWGGLDPHGAG